MPWKKESEEQAGKLSVDGIRGMVPKREHVRPAKKEEEASPENEDNQEAVLETESQQEPSEPQEDSSPPEAQEGATGAPAPPPTRPQVAKIENILSDGLEGLFYEMSGPQQDEFRAEGERAARAIDSLLLGTKVKAGKILKIIRDWLAGLPGVSRLFVEQEAKIKLDRILDYKERQ